MVLKNKTKNKIIVSHLRCARHLWQRLKGLLGTTHLPEDSGMWIIPCNSVHTYFMRYPIDIVFVDRDLKVKALYAHVGPRRTLWPVWGAKSVFELAAGMIEKSAIELGDQLYVGH